MKKRLVLLCLSFLFLMVVCSPACEAQIYKWVDEKGTVHFSDGAPGVAAKDQDRGPEKGQDRSQDKNSDRKQDKTIGQKQIGNQDVRKVKGPDGGGDRRVAKENTQAILKNLEFGNRYIPDDMKKYGPSGGYERRREPDQAASSPSVRRSSS